MTNIQADAAAPDSRTALDPAVAAEIRQRVLVDPGWLRLALASRQGGGLGRTSLRPVMLRNRVRWQLESVREGRTMVRNLDTRAELTAELERFLAATGSREYHLQTAAGDLHARITRKGRLMVSRSRTPEENKPARPAAPQPHDRVKQQPLTGFDSAALLRVLGIADGHGAIRATMRGKYNQINAFLRELDAALTAPPAGRPLEVVDCGSGGAYLTLAAYFHLKLVHGLDVRVRGIDRNRDLVEKASCMARDLDVASEVVFEEADLATIDTSGYHPDLLLSLHACDDATDAALARGVEWGAGTMLVAPCCQHDLQKALGDSGPMRGMLRHGILRERLGDLLTDAFRAQILRILGYRVRIVEFVSTEATARNLMLRAVSGAAPGQAAAVEEYRALRDFWRVTPRLETLLADRLAQYQCGQSPQAGIME